MHAGTERDIGRLSASLLFVKLREDGISRLVLTSRMDSDMSTNIQNFPDIRRTSFAYFVVSYHHCSGLLYSWIQACKGYKLFGFLKP